MGEGPGKAQSCLAEFEEVLANGIRDGSEDVFLCVRGK